MSRYVKAWAELQKARRRLRVSKLLLSAVQSDAVEAYGQMADWVEKVDNAIADRHGWTRLTVKETAELAAEIARDHAKAAQPNQGGE